jgi:hypothetical protein
MKNLAMRILKESAEYDNNTPADNRISGHRKYWSATKHLKLRQQ